MPEEFIRECQIDEGLQDESQIPAWFAKKVAPNYESLSQAIIDQREILSALYVVGIQKDIRKLTFVIHWALERPSRQKRTLMNIDEMVGKWIPLIRQLATCHDVDEKDAASSALDELLWPLLSAPIAQLREFYKKLVAEMKADKSIPWAVWKLFDFWGENVLDKIDQAQELKLKTDLATKIAERSLDQIPREDWLNSMIGALQWRSAERLGQIDKALDEGHKPRVRGKESCLFMQVGAAEVML